MQDLLHIGFSIVAANHVHDQKLIIEIMLNDTCVYHVVCSRCICSNGLTSFRMPSVEEAPGWWPELSWRHMQPSPPPLKAEARKHQLRSRPSAIALISDSCTAQIPRLRYIQGAKEMLKQLNKVPTSVPMTLAMHTHKDNATISSCSCQR